MPTFPGVLGRIPVVIKRASAQHVVRVEREGVDPVAMARKRSAKLPLRPASRTAQRRVRIGREAAGQVSGCVRVLQSGHPIIVRRWRPRL